MIVEFVGMSCAGKSTLIREIEASLEAAGVEVERHSAGGAERLGWGRQSASERRREILAGLREAPGLVFVLATTRRTGSRFKATARYAQAIAYTRRLRSGPTVHLVDEGPIKRLPKGHGWHAWQYRLLHRAVPRAERVVHVVCDTDTRIRRLRETGRYGQRYTDEQLRQQERTTLARLRHVIASHGDAAIEVDPNADPQATRRVVEWILSEHQVEP